MINVVLRSIWIAFSSLFALSAQSVHAAQSFPTHPIRILVGISPGSSVDFVARAIGQKLADGWPQPVVIDNRPGAGGIIAADIAAKATPDSHTLLIANAGITMIATLYRKLPYDLLTDFVPVIHVTSGANLLVVNPSLPAVSVQGLIELAKAKPGQLSFGSSGTGNPDHLAGELFKSMAKIDIFHVPYKGGPLAIADVVAGRIAMDFAGIPAGLPLVKSGKLKAIAVTSLKRIASMQEIPTVAETLPGFEVNLWYGMFAPAKTPRDLIAKVNGEINRVLKLPDIRERFIMVGVEPVGGSPTEFATFLKSEVGKWAQVIKKIGLVID